MNSITSKISLTLLGVLFSTQGAIADKETGKFLKPSLEISSQFKDEDGAISTIKEMYYIDKNSYLGITAKGQVRASDVHSIRKFKTESTDVLSSQSIKFFDSSWTSFVNYFEGVFSPDRKYFARDFATREKDPIGVWDIESMKQDDVFVLNSQGARLQFSPDGRKLVSSSAKGHVTFYDFEESQRFGKDSVLANWMPHEHGRPVNLTFSEDGSSLFTSSLSTDSQDTAAYKVTEWTMPKDLTKADPSKKRVIRFPMAISHGVFTADRKGYYFASENSLAFFNISEESQSPEGKPKLVWFVKKLEDSSVKRIVLSPDGKYLVTESGGLSGTDDISNLILWDAKTGTRLSALKMERVSYLAASGMLPFSSVTFSPDSRRLAVLANNKDHNAIWFWNLD